MSSRSKSKEVTWKPLPTLPFYTFPLQWFIAYIIFIVLLLPIHILICLIIAIYRCIIMYPIHYMLFKPVNNILSPIKSSPDSFVIITGAASGIGKEIAVIFARKGFSLILIDINKNGLESLASELSKKYSNQTFRFLTVDLSDANAGHTICNTILVEWKIQNVVILVNNAGFGMRGEFLNQNLDKLKTMVNVNSTICMDLGHRFGRYFVSKGKGRICQIASSAAYTPGPHSAVYHSTKVFIRYWALALQHELLGTGVGVTVICPGPVSTNFSNASNAQTSNMFTSFDWLVNDPIDIAKATVNATLSGKREVICGPITFFLQSLLGVYGETFDMICIRFLWQNPSSQTRSCYQKYKY